MSDSGENPARWIEDPTGRHELRYWEGSEWTEYVADRGVQAIDAPTLDPPVGLSTADEAPSAPWVTPEPAAPRAFSRRAVGFAKRAPLWAKIAVPAVILIVAVGAIGSLAEEDKGESASTKRRSEVPTATTRTVAPTTRATLRPTTPPTLRPTTPPTTLVPPGFRPIVPTTLVPPGFRPIVPPPAAAPAAPPSNCNPNYSPCVPNDPVDVDCAGGSGNGPSYVRGPVQVIGADVYGLDTDHDGVGCE
jgi:hypothetical protein